MYFHSSSYRHEQYAALRSSKQRVSRKKRSSTSSNTSGVDSGYTSSASSSPNTSSQPSPISRRVIEEDQEERTEQSTHASSADGLSTADRSVADSTSTKSQSKKKKSSRSKRQQQQDTQSHRQPDLVYSCPRPLAFPFHNDAHFLPIAEADPRDVARVSPSPTPRSPSVQSSSIGSTPFDQRSASRSVRSSVTSRSDASRTSQDDSETLRSNRSSILSAVHRGTVRSLRSLFQIPSSSYTRLPASDEPSKNDNTAQAERLPRLEIKKGTVQSLREVFSGRSSQEEPLKRPAASTETNSLSDNLSQASRNAVANSRSSKGFLGLSATSTPDRKSPFSAIFSKARWASKSKDDKRTSDLLASLEQLPKPPTTPPQASKEKSSSPLSGLKKFTSSLLSRSDKKVAPIKQPPVTSSPLPPPPSERPRRSFFAAFRRSSEEPPKKPDAEIQRQPEEEITAPEEPPSVVSRLWKSFKRFVTGNKSSRIGVL